MISLAAPQDLIQLANLIHFDSFVHRHLDYRAPLEWVGNNPFIVYRETQKILAALACPPDPPHVAWIRLFASAHHLQVARIWEILWQTAYSDLRKNPNVQCVAAIPLQTWFARLLVDTEFKINHHILMLGWEGNTLPVCQAKPTLHIRPMTTDDLDIVTGIDQRSFPQLWQISPMYLKIAFQQAAIASVALLDDEIRGFQISTTTSAGGHLARLAVDPDFQGYGIGTAIVCEVVNQFQRRGIHTLTVNTQEDNCASLALYRKIGFDLTGEKYPVYTRSLQENPI